MPREHTPAPPPADVRRAFGARGEPERLLAGEGTSFRVGELVFKPVGDAGEAVWIAEMLDRIAEDGFRVARPRRTTGGSWVTGAWTASEWVEGASTLDRWTEVIDAGTNFHRALRDVPRPAFLDARMHQWAIGDRIAFGDHDASTPEPLLPEPVGAQVRRLRARTGTASPPSQVVHGDLTENVLLAEGLAPAIIDFSPYYRPAGFATAVIAVDAIAWFGAGFDLVELIEPADARHDLLARALIFRLVASALRPARDRRDQADRLERQAAAHAGLVDHAIAGLAAG